MESHRNGIVLGICLAGLIGAGVGTAASANAATILGGVSMQHACDVQYPGYGLSAVVTNQHSAYSWRCTSPWGYSGGISVAQECLAEYGGGAFPVVLNQYDPYSWRCER
jgi:hypothetical protein